MDQFVDRWTPAWSVITVSATITASLILVMIKCSCCRTRKSTRPINAEEAGKMECQTVQSNGSISEGKQNEQSVGRTSEGSDNSGAGKSPIQIISESRLTTPKSEEKIELGEVYHSVEYTPPRIAPPSTMPMFLDPPVHSLFHVDYEVRKTPATKKGKSPSEKPSVGALQALRERHVAKIEGKSTISKTSRDGYNSPSTANLSKDGFLRSKTISMFDKRHAPKNEKSTSPSPSVKSFRSATTRTDLASPKSYTVTAFSSPPSQGKTVDLSRVRSTFAK